MKKIVCFCILLISCIMCMFGCSDTEKLTDKTLYLYGYKSARAMAMTDAGGIVSMEEIEDMIEIELTTWFITSGVPNNSITVKYSDTAEVDAEFICTASKGSFWWNRSQFVKSATIKPCDTLYFQNLFDEEQGKYDIEKGEKVYIDITLSASTKIIGYAVIEVESVNELNFTPTLKKAVVFPKVDGNYQDITEEYMTKVFENVRKGE